MPRNTRNFWIEADVDGHSTTLEGGPVSKDGGFHATVYIRDEGGILRALTLSGMPDGNGGLILATRLGDLDAGDARVTADERGFTVSTRRDPPPKTRNITLRSGGQAPG